MTEAEAFLLDQIPLKLRTMIPQTLKMAYDAVSAHIVETPFLNVPSAQDNRGRLVQWAVDYGFQKLVESGQWPFEMRWRPFEVPTGRYLEIRASHSVLTISQVEDPQQQPRNVHFRANKRLNNQRWISGLPNPEGNGTNGLPHVLLVHGHQTLNFSHLGIPNEVHARGYLFRTPNLMLMPHAVTTQEPPVEQTDIDAVMTLKQEIDKWRRDNGDE